MKVNRFIYPRVIAITRPATNETPGGQDYSGTQKANETSVATGIPCSIQFSSRLSKVLGGTPSDASDIAGFRIFIPLCAAANGLITERDIATDDLGKRYQVFAAYWDSLGYNLQVELLEA